MYKKKEDINEIKNQLKEWDRQLDELQKKLNDSSDDIQDKYGNHVEELKTRVENFKNNFVEMKTFTGNVYIDIKYSFKDAASDISKSINKLISEFDKNKRFT